MGRDQKLSRPYPSTLIRVKSRGFPIISARWIVSAIIAPRSRSAIATRRVSNFPRLPRDFYKVRFIASLDFPALHSIEGIIRRCDLNSRRALWWRVFEDDPLLQRMKSKKYPWLEKILSEVRTLRRLRPSSQV